MKYFIACFLTALFLPCLAFADVKINEVAWMGTTASQYSEWLELYNTGSSDVSLAGWKLYKTGDELLFTLSKTIAAGGYLLVERTTPSAPDAVPGITDEAGSFSNGGLSNSGEDLTLKDSNGTVMDSLSFASGWPAGDSATKDTMQWDGQKWITAPGTPDAVNATMADIIPSTPTNTSSSSTSGSTSSTTSSSGSSSKGSTKTTKPTTVKAKITIATVKDIFQGVNNQYSATVSSADATNNPSGYFYWNMGNGVTYIQSALSPIVYSYPYSGTYTISLSYYSSRTASLPSLQDTASVTVTAPNATLAVVNNGTALQITNNTTKAMDIGQWPISTTLGVRAMPPLTIIASKAHITISAQSLGLASIQNPILHTPDGTVVAGKATKK